MDDYKKQEIFESLKSFLKKNMKIKEDILKLAPTEKDDYDESSRIEYTDRLYKELKYLEETFIDIIKSFELGEYTINSIKEHFNKSKESLLKGHYQEGDIKNLYKKIFSNMDSTLIEQVKENCVGYSLWKESISKLINKSKSVNELLHVIHSYICNDENILGAMPIIDSKNNAEDYPITLFGEESEISKKIFQEFPRELECGWTQIVSMENTILMMIRDRGHALTIDIDTSKKDDIFVKYFVPKLCNRNMIEALPGINKSGITDNGATGIFRTTQEELSKKLFDFIEKVPTDLDIEVPKSLFEHSDDLISEEETTNIFGNKDAKELAMEKSESGTRSGVVIKLKYLLKDIVKGQNKQNDIER